jgi:hypothetical protein
LVIQPAHATNIAQSTKNEIFNNPFIVTGFNQGTHILTGYMSALRTAPGRTDECRVVFSGKIEVNNSVVVLVKNAVKAEGGGSIESSVATKGKLESDSKRKKLVIDKKSLPGDCDWILPFADESKIISEGNLFNILIDDSVAGDWRAVHVIRSKRAYFYKTPEKSNIGKAFVIAGDLIYVYDENKDWYYVKFKNRKKEIVGWIKKSDTIQFP